MIKLVPARIFVGENGEFPEKHKSLRKLASAAAAVGSLGNLV